MPLVAEPLGSSAWLRQMPNGLTPNFTHRLALWMFLETSAMSLSTLPRRQSASFSPLVNAKSLIVIVPLPRRH